ncbi:hypothetical protein [Marinobacter sp. BGYM27]|uniref:hypothetical protein n=1 Tax=Marinobacter sp. BGYM27 TaxID=2975597 RepID=UPI0021A27C53|nr:hypothetical protein [Marinobacter sp. BGYM27]MDG5498980.1 hypothetical protein [Marinobacter sp. BGYM27]
MILNKSDTCRLCGEVKMVTWALIDWRQRPWHERHPPGEYVANNELQQAEPVHVSCAGCGIVYDPESLETAVV